MFCCLQVVDNLDSRLRSMIATAKMSDQGTEDFNFTMPMATIMAIHSFVADGAAATAVGQLASDLAADPAVDISERISKLKKVRAPLTLAPASRGCSVTCMRFHDLCTVFLVSTYFFSVSKLKTITLSACRISAAAL